MQDYVLGLLNYVTALIVPISITIVLVGGALWYGMIVGARGYAQGFRFGLTDQEEKQMTPEERNKLREERRKAKLGKRSGE